VYVTVAPLSDLEKVRTTFALGPKLVVPSGGETDVIVGTVVSEALPMVKVVFKQLVSESVQ